MQNGHSFRILPLVFISSPVWRELCSTSGQVSSPLGDGNLRSPQLVCLYVNTRGDPSTLCKPTPPRPSSSPHTLVHSSFTWKTEVVLINVFYFKLCKINRVGRHRNQIKIVFTAHFYKMHVFGVRIYERDWFILKTFLGTQRFKILDQINYLQLIYQI